jgi:hypothetical protein
VLHRLHFDKLHTQYLDGVVAWAKSCQDLVFTEFSTFDDPHGYAGFVPSGSWLGMLYNQHIGRLKKAMDQQVSMKTL